MSSNNQEDRAVSANQQTLEEFLEYLRIDRAIVQHETEVTARTHRGNHVQRKAAPGHFDNRRFANRRLRLARMVVGVYSRLVSEVDRCPLGFASARIAG